jgi:ABC-2 type transport system ATP-binding protein
MLEVSKFSKRYGTETIITVDALVLKAGVHLIKGDNGSGKTTLFKCLAGILPFTGHVSLHGISLHDKPIAYRYRVNYAEAEPLYPGFLTSRDLVRFISKTRKATPDQEARYVKELGVDGFYQKACDTYSSGMMKKLSLVLAFLGDTRMIILDEPLITLDERTRHTLFKLIAERNDTIFLISSHQAIDHLSLKIDNTYIIQNNTLYPE